MFRGFLILALLGGGPAGSENQRVPDDTASGVSLWLVPELSCEVRLAEILDGLSQEWGTPRFAPHVTLLGNVRGSEREILAESERLAAELEPVALRSLELDWSDEFYRAFYLVVEKQPALLRAHAAAAEAFRRSPDPSYFPHLSLAYGDLTDEQRLQARRVVEKGLGSCRAERLDVVRTTGPPESWKTLATHPLRRP